MSTAEPAAEVTGRVSVNARGFGFLNVTPDDGTDVWSAFIAPPELNGFLTDDLVTAKVTRAADGRASATALSLLERPRRELFGEVVTHRDGLFLKVDREVANTDFPLDAPDGQVTVGERCVARVEGARVRFARKVSAPTDIALEQVIARYAIPSVFSDEAVADARAMCEIPHALGHRRDLRALPTVTVDAPSTRDIDDAISVIPAGADGALRLLVSIADVAEFLREGSALDLEARERATSVYLAGRVIPMLPDTLSAEWISLNPHVDRACLTCEMRIDPEGNVVATDVYESLIRSCARLHYTEVAAFLDRSEVSAAMEPARDAMPWFRTASARIGMARARRGGVEISRDETRVVLDAETGLASSIESDRPTSAHAMIERFMVAANESIAQWLLARGVPAMLRVHDVPDPEKVRDLSAFAHNFGLEAGFGRALTPLSLAAFDRQITGAPSEPAVRSVLLRILGPARYTVLPSMHFGLAAPLYLHFTSPIRRYADTCVHRAIKRYLRGDRAFVTEDPAVETLAQHINLRARSAARAENDRRRCLTAQYMAHHVGETFSARITSARPFGLVVQIDTTLVEGTLPFDALPNGPYRLDPRGASAVSADRTFAVGMPVIVCVESADATLGRIRFSLVE